MVESAETLVVPGWWRSRVKRFGPRAAVEVGPATRTYDELDGRSDQLAAGFAALGVKRGDRVVVMLPNGIDFIETWLALTKIGAVEVPINTAYKGSLLRYLVVQSRCGTIVCHTALVATVQEAIADVEPGPVLVVTGGSERDGEPARREGVRLEDLYLNRLPPQPDLRPADPCVVLYTSGTTGPSKGVVHTNGSTLRLSQYLAEVMDYRSSDTLYNFFPLFHQNARYTGVMPAFDVGARIILGTEFSASRFWDHCREKGVTAFNYLGAVLLILLNQPPAPNDRSHPVVRAFGAGAPPELWPQFEKRFGVRLTEVYGLTEAPMATVNGARRRRLGSSGRASQLFDVQIVDENDRRLPAGEIGEIAVRPKVPSAMMLGYDGLPEQTLEAFRNLWFHTGDRGRMSRDGYLYFVDRLKDCIRRRGENISSWEVERVVTEHPSVLETAVYGVPSPLSEEEVMVAVVRAPGGAADPEGLRKFCAERLPGYAVPSFIRFVEALPRTPTQRVEKYRLRAEGVTDDTWSYRPPLEVRGATADRLAGRPE